jgi:hypothetical protein
VLRLRRLAQMVLKPRTRSRTGECPQRHTGRG